MKSIIQMDNQSNALGLMPFKNKKINNKAEGPKDLLILLPEPQHKQTELKILSVVNMGVYSLKNTLKDKRKIKDAVTVKRMKLLCKENVELKKMPALMNVIKRSSINYSGSTDFNSKKNEKLQAQIGSKLIYNPLDGITGNRTFSSPISPNNYYNRKGLKLERIEKQNEICGTIFQAKPVVTNTKCDDLINTKLKYYLSSVKQGRKLHNLSQQLNKQAKKRALRVRIRKGNNSQLVKWLFKKRWWWTIQDDKDEKQKNKPNFIWSQLKEKSYFDCVPPQAEQNQNEVSMDQFCHNHFPHNEYLGNKKALFYNMRRYYTSNKINVFENLPLTFHVVSIEDQAWKQFTQKYDQFKRQGQNNIWILKPGQNSNRGRGITVHQSYQEIKNIIGSGQTFLDSHDSKTKNRTYIIQSYIDKPFLYNRRKFDIRCYMLLVNINKIVKGYWYSEGYIRTSSFQFQLNDFNTFVHLTNDAIQNHSESYGKYEEGNKLSYVQFQKYLDSKHSGCGYDLEKQIIPQMKRIATDSIKAAIHFVKGQNDRPVFEVFGLDFMIDKNFKPWLIEINTNPCIETSCLVLQKIIPRMLDDSLKLSLDLLFPPPQNWPASRKHCLPSPDNKFQLVYQSQKDEQIDIKTVKFPSLGVITQDGEFYEDKQNDLN